MPLLAFSPQLNSTWSLKSLYLPSEISSGPQPGLTSVSFSTFHNALLGFDLSCVQPARSRPLNNSIGLVHFGLEFALSSGAGTAVQVHGVPSCPVVVPLSILPLSLPSKTMSSLRSSS